ncbi:hypothetical protein SCHPADRAFT_945596 [Schizopora paradoxa]|uniref:Uncharacterized protein n=1 Tax=Schizopora paradoxa TaxID=27342 RepID=A0A0H2RC46_9AGAM|nr:hypothetical protein SCHPADRAFT_945596 [Schizopora paradoxa]
MFDLSLSPSRSSRSSRSSKSSLASTISTSSTSLSEVYDLKYALSSQSTLGSVKSRVIAEDLDDDNVAWGPVSRRKQRRN